MTRFANSKDKKAKIQVATTKDAITELTRDMNLEQENLQCASEGYLTPIIPNLAFISLLASYSR